MPIVTEYFGSALTPRQCWMLEMSIHENHRQDEAALLQSRWFDYRNLLPAQATYLFAAQYRHEYLEGYKRLVDIRTVDQVCPLPPDVFKSSDLVSVWLARREADAIGCKYDFYLRVALDRCHQRGWKSLPRPNQLYGEELTLDVTAAWQQRCREVLQLADSPFFRLDNYVAHPDQDAYHEWVIEQIKSREQRHLALARVMKTQTLPLELAGAVFGPEVLRRAQQFAASM